MDTPTVSPGDTPDHHAGTGQPSTAALSSSEPKAEARPAGGTDAEARPASEQHPDKPEAEARPSGEPEPEARPASEQHPDKPEAEARPSGEPEPETRSSGEQHPGVRRWVLLRALRLGAFLAGVTLVLVAVWASPGYVPAGLAESDLYGLVFIQVCTWLFIRGLTEIKLVGTVIGLSLLAAVGGLAAMVGLRMWWESYQDTTVDVPVLLVVAVIVVALTVFLALDVFLLHLRTRAGIHAGVPEDPVRWRPVGWRRPASPSPADVVGRRTRAACALAPVVTLVLAAVLPTAFLSPATQVTAPPIPAANLPQRPDFPRDGFSHWTRRFIDLNDMTAGAAGPILVFADRVIALNPADGTTRWSYNRPGAYFTQIDRDGGARHDVHIIASPDGHYVALRIFGPQHVLGFSEATTIVLDAVTGEVVVERSSSEWATLQLTDSVALDGYDAISLEDGHILWSLPEPSTNRKDEMRTVIGPAQYSGPAGHSTLILDVAHEFNELPDSRSTPLTGTKTVTLAPDDDPTATTQVDNIVVDPQGGSPLVSSGGWVGQYVEAPVLTGSPDDEEGLPGWSMQAVNLDELAAGTAQPIALGRAPGLHSVATAATGKLVTLGPMTVHAEPPSGEGPLVGAVFDPASRTATPASQYPGLAAASVGVVLTTDGAVSTRSIVFEPADGGTPVHLPLSTTTEDDSAPKVTCPPQQMSTSWVRFACGTAMSAPGVTIAVIDVLPDVIQPRIAYVYGLAEET